MQPLLFIDFDGVFNPSGNGAQKIVNPITSELIPFEGASSTWKVTIDKDNVDFINNIVTNNLAEVIWLTTWSKAVEQFTEKFGFINLPFIQEPNFMQGFRNNFHDWWKLKAIQTSLSSERKIIWLDDAIDTCVNPVLDPDDEEFAEEINMGLAGEWAKTQKVHVFSPVSNIGLTSLMRENIMATIVDNAL